MARSGGRGGDVLKRGLSAAIFVSEATLEGSKWPFAGFSFVRLGLGFGGLEGAAVDLAVRGFFAGGGPFGLRDGAARFFGFGVEKSCSASASASSRSSVLSSVSESSVSESSSVAGLRLFGDWQAVSG